ncbi:MAG: VPLPA-CTERM sorting domain-containing protein [Pseudomonadota bacterium]
MQTLELEAGDTLQFSFGGQNYDGTRFLAGSFDLDIDAEIAPVPLPASAILLIAGLGGLGAMRRMKRG